MKFPCFEHQVTDQEPFYDERAEKAMWHDGKLVIGPDVMKAYYNMAKTYFDKGLDFPETLEKMHERLGLRKSTIAKILAANKKARKLTDDMWYQQARYREIKTQANIMVDNLDTPEWRRNAEHLWDLSRTSATVGHGGVIPFTHARALALGTPSEQKLWGQAVGRAYYWASPRKGLARWERMMETMVDSDKYKEAVRYGVRARPSDKPVGIIANLAKGWGMRGFDALKPLRVDLFHLWKDYAEGNKGYMLPKGVYESLGLKKAPRVLSEEDLKMLANEVNLATGDLNIPAKQARIAANISFAPKVYLARRLEAYAPIRYLWKTGKMTPGERAIANLTLKRWARHMVISAGILEANNLFNQHFLHSGQKVNFDDFKSPGTLWRMNIGGHILPFSPLVEVLRTPVVMTAAMLNTRRELKGQEPASAAAEVLSREILNALHPSLLGIGELITGREMFGVPRHMRRLPFPGAAQLVRGEDPQEREPPMPWAEYVMEKGPIPLAATAKEIFSPALTEEGIPKPKADLWVQGLVNGFLSGLFGVHSFEVSPRATPQATRHKRVPGTVRPLKTF